MNKRSNKFCFEGRIDGRLCSFRIDTGSDVTVLSNDLLKADKYSFPVMDCFLRYPTGEKVLVKKKTIVKIEVGKFILDFPVFYCRYRG